MSITDTQTAKSAKSIQQNITNAQFLRKWLKVATNQSLLLLQPCCANQTKQHLSVNQSVRNRNWWTQRLVVLYSDILVNCDPKPKTQVTLNYLSQLSINAHWWLVHL